MSGDIDAIKSKARELGFDRVGIAGVGPSPSRQFFRDWLDSGRAGAMTFLSDRFDERTDPSRYFPGGRSVICVGLNYFTPDPIVHPPDVPARIARYARGTDYHQFLKDRLFDLADWLRDTFPGAQTRCGTDTVPVLEKELAVRAGVGWMGKNTCVIDPDLGSWMLLGEVLTTLDLPADEPVTDHCGTCTRCLDACPTAALAPYQLDPLKCISYLTIESRGEVPEALSEKIGDWLFGCDICQDVCPWNRKPTPSDEPDVQPRLPASLNAADVLEWTPEAYAAALRHTALKRVKLPVMQQNARRVLANHHADGG